MRISAISDNENSIFKKRLMSYFFYNQNSTIPELSRELNLSVPTVTKLINDMVAEGFVNDYGKGESKVGRKPNTYGLNPRSGYFMGIDLKHNHINLGLCDFNGEFVSQDFDIPFVNSFGSLAQLEEICAIADKFINGSGVPKEKILNTCVNISGRVNPMTGYSYSNFCFAETSISDLLSTHLNMPVCIENDTRSMTYGELLRGAVKGEKDVLYVNLSWGLGLGIVIDGNIYDGKSGFAGEFGHTYAFDNEILCHCGKKGCLETEVSGMALHRELVKCIEEGKTSILSKKVEQGEDINLFDILDAIQNEDILCIDLLEGIAEKLGRHLANLINIFNPELVIIGGTMSSVGEYMIQPIKQAITKHSLKLVSSDTRVTYSKLEEKAGVIGACMVARRHMFERLT